MKRRHFETRTFRYENVITHHFYKNKSFLRHFRNKFLFNKKFQFYFYFSNCSSLKNAVFSKLYCFSHHHGLPKIPFFLKNMIQNLIEITGLKHYFPLPWALQPILEEPFLLVFIVKNDYTYIHQKIKILCFYNQKLFL